MRLAAAALAALALAVPAAAAPVPQAPAGPALAFADALHGWLGTAGGILGTADGGRTWHRRSQLAGLALDTVDARHAWAISTGGKLLGTVDGRSWEVLGVPRAAATSFVDDRQGFALDRRGALIRSVDGGRSWTRVRGAPVAQALCFADRQHGWLARGGIVYSTSNAGVRSRPRRLLPDRQGFPIPTLDCRGSDVWVVFHEGAGAGTEGYDVFRSLDGGVAWREVLATPWRQGLPHISNYSGPFAVLGHGGAVLAGSCAPCGGRGTTTIVSTRDGGRTFSRRMFPGLFPQAISFPDPAHGWLLESGRVLRLR